MALRPTVIVPGIKGVKQFHNSALAIRAMELAIHGPLDPDLVQIAIIETRAPGRFEVNKIGSQTWIFDGAHNQEAAAALRQTMETEFPGQKATLITNMVGSTPYEELLLKGK